MNLKDIKGLQRDTALGKTMEKKRRSNKFKWGRFLRSGGETHAAEESGVGSSGEKGGELGGPRLLGVSTGR